MQTTKEEMLQELAERIYDLDAEVYATLGSSLGRVFNRDRESCVRDLIHAMQDRQQGHIVRSSLALISNMARTIPDKEERSLVMTEYNRILQQVINLPTSFGEGNILDQTAAKLNTLRLKGRFSPDDHLVICISRTYGCGGSEIGFTLADSLKISYYDAEIFNTVLDRLEAEKDTVNDQAGFPYQEDEKKYRYEERAFLPAKKQTLGQKLKDFNRYHGLSKRDAVFFNQSDLICDMARKEDFVVMGRCADVILTNNRIPHISIFITAPFDLRVHRIMNINPSMTEKQCRSMVRRLDREHKKYYHFYTGHDWGKAINYDLCINSACYGIEGAVDLIHRMINR